MKLAELLSETIDLKRNSELNPVLWDGDELKPAVRTALLNFAEAWRKFAKIPSSSVIDVVMVGGNAGYLYNEASDIDVHLIVDKSSLGFGTLADDHLKDRKALWTIRHDVRIKGYSVEPYAQDVAEAPVAGQGVYSLQRGEWVQKPARTEYDPTADSSLAARTRHWKSAIDKLLQSGTEEDVDTMKKKISEMRSRAISRGGELSRDNLVFKSLRLSGHLDMMSDYAKKKTSEKLSLY